jgi:hypothetical protein
MSKHRKTWSKEERGKVLLYAQKEGIAEASREYGVSSTSIYKWQGESSSSDPSDDYMSMERELKRLQRENKELKHLVADKELAIQVKDALLKKVQSLKK